MSASPQLTKEPGATPERRRNPRRPIVDEQIVAVTLDGDNGGLVLDLAENGMAVQAVTALQAGKTTEMAFVLPDNRTRIRAQGVVRWAESSGRAGIRLLAFSEGSAGDIRSALLRPAAPAVIEPPASRPLLAVEDLEKEIADRGLERDAALAFVAERMRGWVSASGIAIALGSRQEMICRASAGAAPPVGARLQSNSGLSGECVRTGRLVRCDDTETDVRVDAAVCRQLELRSAVLLPILDSGDMRGVLEIFFSQPRAFASDDIRRFEQVAALVANIAREPAVPAAPVQPERAAAPVLPVTPAPVAAHIFSSVMEPEGVSETEPANPDFSGLRVTLTSPAIRLGAAIGAVLVLVLVGGVMLRTHRPARAAAAASPVVTTAASAPVNLPAQPSPEPAVAPPGPKHEAAKPVREPQPSAQRSDAAVSPGLEMRELPTAVPGAQSDPVAPPVLSAADTLPELAAPAARPVQPRAPASPQGIVAGRLLHRVDPLYPELARRGHMGGTVVLNAVIRPDGKVGSVQVVSGNPLLAHAAVEAVQQWRYEPFRLNGTAVQADVTVRLNFNPNR